MFFQAKTSVFIIFYLFRLYLNTENHQFKLYKLKTKTIYICFSYIIAVWESDMLNTFFKFRLN